MIEFKAEGWGGKNKHAIEGLIYDNQEDMTEKRSARYKIKGTWSGSLTGHYLQEDGKTIEPLRPAIDLWTGAPDLDRCEEQFYFTDFTLQLNHLTDKLRAKLPPTDSRLRPDQRALEQGED